MSHYFAAGVGSLLLPEAQEKRILDRVDAMRHDALERVDKTAGKVTGAVLFTGIVTVGSTAALLATALKLRRGR
jgi:hypothetical protein